MLRGRSIAPPLFRPVKGHHGSTYGKVVPPRLMRRSELTLGLAENRHVLIGILPQGKEPLLGFLAVCLIVCQHISSG